jgi:hypothetical protein
MTTRYTFDDRSWSASGARGALLRAAADMRETGVPRFVEGANYVEGGWSAVAARPAVASQVMDDARTARSILILRRKARDARDRSGRAADIAERDPEALTAQDWVLMSRSAFHDAERYAARAAVMAYNAQREETP